MRGFILTFALLFYPASSFAVYEAGGGGCAPVEHVPSADVEYKAGVDSSGYALAPADVYPPALSAEDVANPDIHMGIPLGNYVKEGSYNADLSDTRIAIGDMHVKGNDVLLGDKTLKGEGASYYDGGCKQ